MTLAVSSLAIGDLPALEQLGLEAVGIVHASAVGRIQHLRKFSSYGPFNRGPGYRPGTPSAYFGFLWDDPQELKMFLALPANSKYSMVGWYQSLREAEFDPNAPRRTIGARNGFGYMGSPSTRSRRISQVRRWGLDGGTAMDLEPGLVFETGENTATVMGMFNRARTQLLQRASALGAEGIVGVVDEVRRLSTLSSFEIRMIGTAVRRVGTTAPLTDPWSTYVPAQQLSRIISSGRMPVSIEWSYLNLVSVHTPRTEYLEGTQSISPQALVEHERFRELGFSLTRDRLAARVQGDELHGMELDVRHFEPNRSIETLEVFARVNRVRRFSRNAAAAVPSLYVDMT